MLAARSTGSSLSLHSRYSIHSHPTLRPILALTLTLSCRRNLLDKGAVRIKWPEDVEFDEKESAIWSVLKPEDFNEQRHLGRRFSAASIQRLAQGERPTRAETPETPEGEACCPGADQPDADQPEPRTVRKKPRARPMAARR